MSDGIRRQLNDDVLAQIIAELVQQSTCNLLPLSETCHLSRTLCKPFIFSHATCHIGEPVRSRRMLIPTFMWPYIRYLMVIDDCPDQAAGAWVHARSAMRHLYYARDPYLCGVLESPKLFSLLRHMPRLTKISLNLQDYRCVHGVSWATLKSILALPQLREFWVDLLLSPTQSPSHNDETDFSPLTLLHHERGVSDIYPPTTTERANIRYLLTKLCLSLEVLTLPAELVPVSALSSWNWPRLRELRVRGARWDSPSTPYTTLFSNMRNLRVLVLELSLSVEAEPRPISDPAMKAFPWPDLEHFSVSHPVVHDSVYAHLPRRLRVLTLSCCPHKAEKPALEASDRVYAYPTRTGSEILEILQRCRAQELLELQIEYHADESENLLLGFLSSAFPKLQSLEIYRYRHPNTGDIAVVSSTCL
ncbi:hypothetical protein K466DRAFT_642610 [Polyporus arcularius HHB13444]|uniref:F-box domain-containing protein n=1 Tax=Polyporus arcularius HHB13444 TaxID=1314778 RepID=A0A5C3Q0W1_9APHY|nr:hypothetical protein K466DRAFT_642610 [Polyporus arcularius HHB13444]